MCFQEGHVTCCDKAWFAGQPFPEVWEVLGRYPSQRVQLDQTQALLYGPPLAVCVSRKVTSLAVTKLGLQGKYNADSLLCKQTCHSYSTVSPRALLTNLPLATRVWYKLFFRPSAKDLLVCLPCSYADRPSNLLYSMLLVDYAYQPWRRKTQKLHNYSSR